MTPERYSAIQLLTEKWAERPIGEMVNAVEECLDTIDELQLSIKEIRARNKELLERATKAEDDTRQARATRIMLLDRKVTADQQLEQAKEDLVEIADETRPGLFFGVTKNWRKAAANVHAIASKYDTEEDK